MTTRYIVGDSLTVMRTLPDASVDLVLTSPPYLGLRSYLPADHPDKGAEMGSEATPGAYIDRLLDIVEECRRLLAPHGSLCLELGDSYAGSGGAGGDYNLNGLREGQERFDGSAVKARNNGDGVEAPRPPRDRWRNSNRDWPESKSLCLIPESLRWAMVYGRNPFTGRETERWRARNVVRHFRPNPPVGALADKVRPATSEWLVACTSRSRYFDLDSVRVPWTDASVRNVGVSTFDRKTADGTDDDLARRATNMPTTVNTHGGAPPLDWWDDDDLEWRDAAGFVEPTFGYPGAHYATFSPSVIARLIEPQCPRRVCTVCGKPSERMVDTTVLVDGKPGRYFDANRGSDSGRVGIDHNRFTTDRTTTGWTDCGHNAWRPGLVLDPFGGSGVTGMVASGHGRDCILIDVDERNAHLARERIGMFLEVDHLDTKPPTTVDVTTGTAL